MPADGFLVHSPPLTSVPAFQNVLSNRLELFTIS